MSDGDASRVLHQFSLLSAPGYLLRRNNQRSVDIFSQYVGTDVTRQQIGTLLALERNPGASQRDLVDATGVDKSTLKEMLNRMVERGWVARKRDATDSRAWTMSLTIEGRDLLLERIEKVAAAQQEMLRPLSSDDRATLLRCLRALLGIEPVK